MKRLRWFRKSEDGYVLVLSLIALPAFLLMALLIIDISRGNNAHSDLQAAADSLALAGAKELDGDSDAITSAKAEMAELVNTVSLLEPAGDGLNVELRYVDEAGNPFTVIFLSEIPTDDADPIDQDWVNTYAVTEDEAEDANYVYVRAQSRDLLAIFAAVRETITGEVPISAEAVATLGPAIACNITPIFICNPVENPSSPGNGVLSGGDAGADFNTAFTSGNLYGRLFQLSFESADSAGPGNFGFLRNFDNGANALREALAIGDSGICYEADGVDLEPGATVGPVQAGINAHFGIYQTSLPDDDPLYRPAPNVRMGQANPNKCNEYDEGRVKPNGSPNPLYMFDGMALPMGPEMESIGGGFVQGDGSAGWDNINFASTPLPPWYSEWGIYELINPDDSSDVYEETLFNLYWDINFGGHSGPLDPFPTSDTDSYSIDPTTDTSIESIRGSIMNFRNTWPGDPANMPDTPSRYDTYVYETENGTTDLRRLEAPNNETGKSQCTKLSDADYYNDPAQPDPPKRPRRIVIAAVINCIEHADLMKGTSADNIPYVAYAKMFLTKPVDKNAGRLISMEVIDKTGPGGLDTLDEIRRDVLLVR